MSHTNERIIDGILHFRTTPKGEWQIAGIDTLNRKLSEARAEVERLKRDMAKAVFRRQNGLLEVHPKAGSRLSRIGITGEDI